MRLELIMPTLLEPTEHMRETWLSKVDSDGKFMLSVRAPPMPAFCGFRPVRPRYQVRNDAPSALTAACVPRSV